MAKVIKAADSQPLWGASMAIEERYRPMVAKLEAAAAKNPGAYRFKVFCRALLGYAYIFVVVGGVLIATAAIGVLIVLGHVVALAAKLVLVLLIGLFYVVRSLFVKMSPPDGIRLKARQAPILFAMLNDVRRKVRGPRIDQVYVTTDFNASIRQMARFGPFAGYRNILSLGLPLLTALPPEEVMAVIGHEYGHFAGAHGKMTAWVYRVRMTWLQLSQNLRGGWLNGLFSAFFKWYGPWFNAYSFVLARGDEYQADRASAQVTSARLAARALTRVEIASQRHGKFWSSLFEREGRQERAFPYAGLESWFGQPVAAEALADGLRGAMAEETDMHDTHPSLKDRLAALGETPPDLPPVVQTGAAALLGDELVKTLSAQFDAEWWQQVENAWEDARATGETRRSRLTELQAVAAARALDDAESWEYQEILEAEGCVAAARGVAEIRLAQTPDNIDAQLAAARLRLDTGDASGLDLMDRALAGKLHDRTRLWVLETCSIFLHGEAPDNRRAAYQSQFETTFARYEAVREELNSIGQSCVLEAAGLDEAGIAAVRARVEAVPAIRTVWLARRRLKADPDTGQLVLLYECRAKSDENLADALLATLQAYDNAFVIAHGPATDWLKKRMQSIDGSRVLKR